MRRVLPLLLVLAALASAAFAGQTETPRERVRYRLWRVPLYAVLGLPRDVIDAPVKGLSSVPVVNGVFIAPLYLANILTSYACWSFTEEGVAGGFNAWFDCARLGRKPGKHTPRPMIDRPGWKNYFPNWRTFRIITREPVPQAREPEGQ